MQKHLKSTRKNISDNTNPIQITVVAGDEGNSNIGDQAMFLQLVNNIRSRIPDCRIVSLSRKPQTVMNIPGIDRLYGAYDFLLAERGFFSRLLEREIPRSRKMILIWRTALFLLAAHFMKWRLPAFFVSSSARKALKTLNNSALVLSCGGGYLNTIWTYESLWPYCIFYRAAASLGKPVVLSGQGIGPINTRLDRAILRWGLKRADLISLRELGEGRDYLESIGISGEKIVEAGDDAASLQVCDSAELASVCRSEGIPTDKTIITAQFRLTSHTRSYSTEFGEFAKVLDRIIEREDCHIVFVPIAYSECSDDRLAAFAVKMHMKHKENTTIVTGNHRPEVIKALIGMGRAAIGVSYHFGVFALTQGVPFFAVYENEYYRLKFSGLYGHFGSPDWYMSFENAVPDEFALRVSSVIGDNSIRQRLLDHAVKIRVQVDSVYDRIAELAGGAKSDE